MRTLLLSCVVVCVGWGQVNPPPPSGSVSITCSGSATCTPSTITGTGVISATGGTPSGAAGAAIGGTYPNNVTIVGQYSLSNYSNLAAALTAIGSNTASLAINEPVTITTNTTIPANVTLYSLTAGNVINCTGSPTITVNGPIVAGNFQVFGSGCAAGGVDLSSNQKISGTVPEWYGAIGDNSTDNCNALKFAVASSFVTGSGLYKGKPLNLSGTYNTSCEIDVYSGTAPVSISGPSPSRLASIYYTGSTTQAVLRIAYDNSATGTAANVNGVNGLVLSNLSIGGGGTATYGLQLDSPTKAMLSNVVAGYLPATGGSACFYINNPAGVGANLLSCAPSATNPQYGFKINGGDTFTCVACWSQGAGLYSAYLQTPSNIAAIGAEQNITFIQPHFTSATSSLVTDAGSGGVSWSNVIIQGGDVGEGDTGGEEITSYAGNLLIKNANMQSPGIIHIKAGTLPTLEDISTAGVTIDSGVLQARINHVEVPLGSLVDAGTDTEVSNLAGANGVPLTNSPTYYKCYTAPTGISGSADPICEVSGVYGILNAGSQVILPHAFTVGKAWKLDLIANWANFGLTTDNVPPFHVTLNDVQNTVTTSQGTLTFSVNGSGFLQIAKTTGSQAIALSLWAKFTPESSVTAGSGTQNDQFFGGQTTISVNNTNSPVLTLQRLGSGAANIQGTFDGGGTFGFLANGGATFGRTGGGQNLNFNGNGNNFLYGYTFFEDGIIGILGKKYGGTHGSNGTMGAVALSSGAATVATTALATLATSGGSGDIVVLSEQVCSGTCTTIPVLATATPGTGFTISASVTDNSIVYWEIRHIY